MLGERKESIKFCVYLLFKEGPLIGENILVVSLSNPALGWIEAGRWAGAVLPG